MKKLVDILLLLTFVPSFMSCNDEDLYEPTIATEKFSIWMAVTNDNGEDLVYSTDDYLGSGDYAGRYMFEAWDAYLDKKLVQSDKEDMMSRFKQAVYNPKMEQYFIILETDGQLQRQMKDWNKKHQAKYLITSPSLFGDTKEHVIDLEVLGITDEVNQHFYVEFSVSVDGVKQTVYYPEWWEGMYPKDPHALVDRPYFVLNVDAL